MTVITSVGTKTKMLLIDDQDIIGEAVRNMVANEPDIEYYYCKDPTQAIKLAEEVKPTVILQDLVMPEIDGLTLVKYFRANPSTKKIPLIVLSSKEEPITKQKAFECGANDYLVKLPDKIELLARIRYHSKAYTRLLERDLAYSQIQQDLDQAASYVMSLLPQPIVGRAAASWAYIPSSKLGGDSFGYRWLDDDYFCIYLLDVCGHGVGAALMSISVMNLLGSSALMQIDLRKPAAVLAALNDSFSMEKHGGRFFTIWYGVYHAKSRQLVYATAGHPPALLLSPGAKAIPLQTDGFVIGGLPDSLFKEDKCHVPHGSTLYVFSDGVYEIESPSGQMQSINEFIQDIESYPTPPTVDTVLKRAQSFSKKNDFDDDFSIVSVAFQ